MIWFLAVLYVLIGLAFAFFAALLDDMQDVEFRLESFVIDALAWPYFGFKLAMEAYEYYKEKYGER